jgi:hypothetical protein
MAPARLDTEIRPNGKITAALRPNRIDRTAEVGAQGNALHGLAGGAAHAYPLTACWFGQVVWHVATQASQLVLTELHLIAAAACCTTLAIP